jgi:hypothetical protein
MMDPSLGRVDITVELGSIPSGSNLLASFIIYYHSQRLPQLEQTLRFLCRRETAFC